MFSNSFRLRKTHGHIVYVMSPFLYEKLNSKKWYLATITIRGYEMLYLFIIDVIVYQMRLLMFYNVQTTTLTFVDKI